MSTMKPWYWVTGSKKGRVEELRDPEGSVLIEYAGCGSHQILVRKDVAELIEQLPLLKAEVERLRSAPPTVCTVDCPEAAKKLAAFVYKNGGHSESWYAHALLLELNAMRRPVDAEALAGAICSHARTSTAFTAKEAADAAISHLGLALAPKGAEPAPPFPSNLDATRDRMWAEHGIPGMDDPAPAPKPDAEQSFPASPGAAREWTVEQRNDAALVAGVAAQGGPRNGHRWDGLCEVLARVAPRFVRVKLPKPNAYEGPGDTAAHVERAYHARVAAALRAQGIEVEP